MRPLTAIATLTLALFSVAGDALAQVTRPQPARRLVRAWDFEEAATDPRPVPPNWFRAQDNPPERARPGFPKEWNLALLDSSVAHSGQWSVKLPTNGGSTSLMLVRGVLPAMPGADYVFSGQILTGGLVHARACIAARLLDERLEIISGSDVIGDPVISQDQWTPVRISLPGSDRAAWVQLELLVLQPDQLVGSTAPTHQVRHQDVNGAAWFDDLQLMQLPRLELISGSPAGVTVAPDRPQLVVRIQDLTGEPIDAELRVYDLDGNEVAQQRISGTTGPQTRTWRPEIDRFGWYRAAMRVSGAEGLIGETHTDFIWSPPPTNERADTSRRFCINLPSLPAAAIPAISDLIDRAGSGALSVPVPTGDPKAVSVLRPIVEQLVESGHEVTFLLERAPVELAREARADADDVLSIFASSGDAWTPALNPILGAFGERVRRYQVGEARASSGFWRNDLDTLLPAIDQRLRMLIPRPTVVVPWMINQRLTFSSANPRSLSILVPQSTPADSIPLYAASWPIDADITLALDPFDVPTYGERAVAVELARKAIVAWSTGVSQISIPAPWQFEDPVADRILPRPALAAWRTVADQLSEREPAGTLPVVDGITAFIARGADDSALVAWDSGVPDGNAMLRGYLGEKSVHVRDLFGNSTEYEPRNGEHTIPLGPEPVFIEGIDANLARFRAGIRIEPPFIPARAQKHDLSIIIANPWPVSVTGRLRVADPADWDISPRVASFTIAGGGQQRVPVTVAFGLGEEAGPRTITVEVNLSAERVYPTMRAVLPVEIGLETVQLQPSLRLIKGAGGPRSDLEVSLLVTNTGDQPISLESFALAPGFRGQQAPISMLGAGQSALRRFVFENAAAALHAKTIRVGLKEIDGSGRVNRTLTVP